MSEEIQASKDEGFPGTFAFVVQEYSCWYADICGVSYVPNKGDEPNRFHRWMHKLAFGIVWSKK